MVLIRARVHPFPSRTRKLSSLLLTILGWRRPGKIGSANTEKNPLQHLLQGVLFFCPCALSLCPLWYARLCAGPTPSLVRSDYAQTCARSSIHFLRGWAADGSETVRPEQKLSRTLAAYAGAFISGRYTKKRTHHGAAWLPVIHSLAGRVSRRCPMLRKPNRPPLFRSAPVPRGYCRQRASPQESFPVTAGDRQRREAAPRTRPYRPRPAFR